MCLKAVYQHIVDNILAVVATSCLVALVRLGLVELISWLRELRPAHLFLAGFVPAAAATMYLMLRPCTVHLIIIYIFILFLFSKVLFFNFHPGPIANWYEFDQLRNSIDLCNIKSISLDLSLEFILFYIVFIR